MNIECLLDYSTVLANQGRPVHLSVRLQAGTAEVEQRRPMAFCVVLDRSGSMGGKPLDRAKTACETVIRNLRAEDEFALVTFDTRAQVVVPLQKITDRQKTIAAVRAFEERGMTNLTGGWMLGRDELLKFPAGTTRRLLLLSDGFLNQGITDPGEVVRIVGDGLERGKIRSSTLGFGDAYDETLLDRLATSSGGNFYDANSADKLPAIFTAELEGLQKTAAQNVRVRIRKRQFCERWKSLASYYSVPLPDGRTEVSLGDLVSEESATAVFELEVLPLPLLADSTPAASLEGEELLELEFLWDDLTGGEVKSCSRVQTLRILATQDPDDVKVNVDVLPGVATQRAGVAVDAALREMEGGRVREALEVLREALRRLKELGRDDQVADGVTTLESMIARIEAYGDLDARSSKTYRYRSSHMLKMKSRQMWTLDEPAPGYSEQSTPPSSEREGESGEAGQGDEPSE